MKKRSLVVFVFVITLLYAFTCRKDKNCHSVVTFENRSLSSIYMSVSSTGYPDTNSWKSLGFPNPALDGSTTKVESDTQNRNALHAGNEVDECFEYYLNKPETNTIMVFVFDANVLETMPWDTVKAKNLYLKRHDLSLQNLQNSNWTIIYP